MFWGLILKANKKYTQLLEKPFHLTKASLDYSNSDDDPVQVMYYDGQSTFLLCTLQKDKELQCSLDLNFAEGDTVCFSTKGNGIVHLTGYLIPEDEDFDYSGLEGEQESGEEEESEDEGIPQDLRELLQKKKKKGAAAAKDDSDESADDSDEEEANGDSSMNSSGIMEEDDDEDDSDDDDDDDEEDDDESEEEEEEVAPPKPKQAKLDPQQQKKQNGVEKNGQDKKNKKDKKAEKQQPPQKEQQQGKKDKEPQQGKKEKENKQADNKIQKLQGGLVIQDLKPGSGAEAKPGKKIQVYYEGRLKSNNKVFDSTKSGAGFKLTLGRGEVIKGWDLGLAGMKVGGKRRITCPPGLAYGAKGNPPVIPANSTLVFDVELKNVL